MFKNGVCIVILLALLMVALPSFAQDTEVKASVDKQKIVLGEPLLLKLEIKTTKKDNAKQFQLDTIPHFEFLKKDSIVRQEIGGVQVTDQYYRITSFDSGRWVIPSITLTPEAKTEAVFVEVTFSSPFDASQPYHDIQDVRSVPFHFSKKMERWWYLIALLLIIITCFVYWATEDKKPKQEAKIVKGAYLKAKQQLKELQLAHLPENRFYARLVEIFRAYLLERTGVNSLHQTSGDLVVKIKPLFSDNSLYQEVGHVLTLCDLVKFAKYDPVNTETKSAFEVIDRSIDHVEEGIKHSLQKARPVTDLKKQQE